METKKQVDVGHYNFASYFKPGRWMSYYYQASEILKIQDIESVLEIGPGTDFMKNVILEQNPSIRYKTMDVAHDVLPDLLGEVTKIPLEDASYDIVCAFQVLEHIPFESFELALSEISRVAKRYVILSLPHYGLCARFEFKIPLLPKVRCSFKFPSQKRHQFDGQHYWEIGKRGFSLKKVKSILEEHFVVTDTYTPYENQYHRFFVLKKKC